MSGKSSEEVAFDLVSKLKGMGVWGERNMPDILDMYAECLDACKGKRQYVPGRAVLDPESRAKLDAKNKEVLQARQQQQRNQQAAQQRVAPTQAPTQQVQPQQQVQTQQRIMPTQVQTG